MYTVHCTLYAVHCTLYTVHCTLNYQVLAVNHVYEILALVSQGRSWKEAFMEVIPERKGAVVREEEEEGSDHDDQGDCDSKEEDVTALAS